METNIIKMMGIADIASLLNALSGMFAIFAAYYHDATLSALLLILAVLFDAIDGPLARRFPSQTSEVFGETIDSLADVISFGIAPAVIIFELFTTPLVVIPSVLLLACGILRLSRYNTIITQQVGPTKTFIGLPIPVSSFMLSLILLSHLQQELLVIIIMTLIAVLMVSSLKYAKMKNKVVLGLCGILLVPTLIYPINDSLHNIPSYVLIILVIIYLLTPLIGERI